MLLYLLYILLHFISLYTNRAKCTLCHNTVYNIRCYLIYLIYQLIY